MRQAFSWHTGQSILDIFIQSKPAAPSRKCFSTFLRGPNMEVLRWQFGLYGQCNSVWHYYWSICSPRRQRAIYFCDDLWHNEVWCYRFQHTERALSVQWKHLSSPCPMKFKSQSSVGKVLLSCFLRHCTADVGIKEPDITISAQHYCGTLLTPL